MDNSLQKAITLLKAGNKQQGAKMLAEIVDNNPQNVNAWLWLSSCVNSDEQRQYCLKKVLEIEPNHSLALSALSKLEQIGQPTEKEILGYHNISDQTISKNDQIQSESTTPKVEAKKTSFQPKYLPAIAGMVIVIGTAFPWAAVVSGQHKIEEYSGFTVAPGILTALIGLAIVFITIFQHSEPGKANSLISALFALLTFLMACLWATVFSPDCFEAFFDPNATCYRIGTGFGYGLSMFSLFFTFILGLIPNPKN